MNRDDRNRNPDMGNERNRPDEVTRREGEGVSDRDTDLQREGNLGNERNRNRSDSDRGHSDIDDLER
jgi:hypothetical protein